MPLLARAITVNTEAIPDALQSEMNPARGFAEVAFHLCPRNAIAKLLSNLNVIRMEGVEIDAIQ